MSHLTRRPGSSARPRADTQISTSGGDTQVGGAAPGTAPAAGTMRTQASPRTSARGGSGPSVGTGRMAASRTSAYLAAQSPQNSSASAGSRSPIVSRTSPQDVATPPSKGSSHSPADLTTPPSRIGSATPRAPVVSTLAVVGKDSGRATSAEQGVHTPLRRQRQNGDVVTPQRETPRSSGSRGVKAGSRQSSRADLSTLPSTPMSEVLHSQARSHAPLGATMRAPLSAGRSNSSRRDLEEVSELSANSASGRRRDQPAASRESSPARSISPWGSPNPKHRPIEHKDGATPMVGRKQMMMTCPTTRSKMGGRMVGVSYPKDVWAKVMQDASEEKVRRLRAAPREELVREFAYGYNSSCRRNIFALGDPSSSSRSVQRQSSASSADSSENYFRGSAGKSGHIPRRYVYSVASLGVVYDVEQNSQRFFAGHSREVTAIAYNEALRICATAQRHVGRAQASSGNADKQEPLMRVCVWTVDDQVERLRLHSYSCCADHLAFSSDGRWLFSVGGSQPTNKRPTIARDRDGSPRSGRCENEDRGDRHRNSTQNAIFVWEISESTLRVNSIQVPTHEMPRHVISRVIDASTGLTPHPAVPEKLICCGPSCVTFLRGVWGVGVPGGEAESEVQRPVYVTDSLAEHAHGFTAVTYDPSSHLALASTETGVILIYECVPDGVQCLRMCEALAGNAVHFLEWGSAGLLIAGGADCGISFLRLDASGDLDLLQRCPLRAPGGAPMMPHAAQVSNVPGGGLRLLVGTTGGELALVDINDHCPQVALVQKTPWHEVRGAIAVHPSLGSVFAVGDASGCIWFYDAAYRMTLQAPPYICQAAVRCMDWDPHGQLLACGLETGRLEVVLTMCKDKAQKPGQTAEGPAPVETLFLLTMQVLPTMPGGEQNCINDIRFSPAKDGGRWLACGCRDGRVVIFSVLRSEVSRDNMVFAHCARHRVLTGNSSAVLFLQFSNDGTQVCSNTKDGQLVAWDVESGEWRYPAITSWSEETHPFRLTMAWETLGIWNSDRYDYTAALVAASDWSARWLAVGDHTGQVKLHSFPLPVTTAESRNYTGHCSRIAGVAWTPTGKLLTVGAKTGDCVMQWRLHIPGGSSAQSSLMGSLRALPAGQAEDWELGHTAGDTRTQVKVTVQTIEEQESQMQGIMQTPREASIQANANAHAQPPATPPVTPVDSLVPQELDAAPHGAVVAPPTLRLPAQTQEPAQDPAPGSSPLRMSSMSPRAPEVQRLSSAGSSTSPRATTQMPQVPQMPRASVQVCKFVTSRDGEDDDQSPFRARMVRLPQANVQVQRLVSVESSPSPRSGAQVQRFSSMASMTSVESSPRSKRHIASDTPLTPLVVRSTSEAAFLPHGITSAVTSNTGAVTSTRSALLTRSATGAALRSPSPGTMAPQPPRILVRQVRALSPTNSALTMPTQALPLLKMPAASQTAAASPPHRAPAASFTPVKPPPSSFSVRVLDVNSGRMISSAMVYLYHPPFALDAAVDYATNGDGPAVELFWPPRGWGVLRSSAGLLLWLSLTTGSLLEERSISVNADGKGAGSITSEEGSEALMRFDFEAAGGITASVEAVSLGQVEGHMPLLLDEGLLHPQDGRGLHVRFAGNLDITVKEWLSSVSSHSREVQSKKTAISPAEDRPQPGQLLPQPDAKNASTTSLTKHVNIIRSFTS